MEKITSIFRKTSSAYWPFVACVFIVSASVLIGNGHIPVKEIIIDGSNVSALLGKGDDKGWKKLLATAVKEAKGEWTEDVGMFLYVNRSHNLDGRLARNVGEICLAVRYARGLYDKSDGPECAPSEFAQTQLALDELKDIRFRADSYYVKARYKSYSLTTLGEQAFEEIRKQWLLAGGEKAKKLGLLDLGFPGLKPFIRNAHKWFVSTQHS